MRIALFLCLAMVGCNSTVAPTNTAPPGIQDADGDGVPDASDLCPGHDDSADSDGDGDPDACDPCPDGDDRDGDGTCDEDDPCPDDPNDDSDGDGSCDSDDPCPLDAAPDEDDDGDGVCNADDQCPGWNDAGDVDADGVPNGCDACPFDNPDDSDGDGRCDTDDVCPGFDDALDADGDNQPDGCDPCPNDNPNDSDGDGVCESVDPCPFDFPDDTDLDGVCDSDDLCPGSDDSIDVDADGYPDACDPCPGDTLNSCLPPDSHMSQPFNPPSSNGQWCNGQELVYFEYFGELTFDECQATANRTGSQWYVGAYTAYDYGWVGEQDGTNAVTSNGGTWGTELVVPKTDLRSCQLGVFDHRTAPTVYPVEQIYLDVSNGRVWHYWDLVGQTHSQAVAFADTLGARIINPNSVGLTGLARHTAPTHWCHAGAQFNGPADCNSDDICDFMVGYWE